jgi:hypothetical protein
MPQFLSYPPLNPDPGPNTIHVLVYFISGNPGLIDYYGTFLSTLHSLLSSTSHPSRPVAIQVYGQNLAGFDDSDHEPFTAEKPPNDLAYVMQCVAADVSSRTVEAKGPRHGTAFDNIILIGHSVGTFISLELFNAEMHGRQPDTTTSVPTPVFTPLQPLPATLTAGILLFPTVTDLVKSVSGRRLDIVRTTAFLNAYAHRLAKGFINVLPQSVLSWAIRSIIGMPPDAAEVTSRWLRSRDGIWQAIHLGKDELRVISKERWSEELWEIAAAAEDEEEKEADIEADPPKFVFYFGESDGWVDDVHRDHFIERRNAHAAREGPRHKRGRTRIIIDQDGLPHAFCLRKISVPPPFCMSCLTDMRSRSWRGYGREDKALDR